MPSDERIAIDVDGQQREFLLHLPVQAGGSAPLVVMFPGTGATAKWTAEETKWSDYADRKGFAVVYPEGLPHDPSKPAKFLTNPPYWRLEGKDRVEQQADLKFISLMLDTIIERFPIDRRRLFATGFSNGAEMTFAVAARMAERISAIAPIAGHCAIDDPRPSRPVPTFYIVGDSDPLVPLAGGRVRTPWRLVRQRPSVAETLKKWARAIGCAETSVPLAAPEGARLESFPADDDPERFLALTIAGLGHQWPGGKGRFSEKIGGKRVSGIDACERIWDFFERIGGEPS